jgi:3-hydroxypropanoate dehydrogenase
VDVERTEPPAPAPDHAPVHVPVHMPEHATEHGAVEQGPATAVVPDAVEPVVAEMPADVPIELPAETVLVSVRVGESGRDVLFRQARTVSAWRDEAVSDDTLREMYDLLKMGPTSANCSPARFLFLRTEYSKDRLRPALSAGNAEKAAKAPVVCIVAHDPKFYEDLPRLFPSADARSWFAGNDELSTVTAFRNGTLQGAYLIMAARAVGLDCAPMSGFDNDTVDREFLVAQGWKSNFLVALGHGDQTGLGERAPRLTFDEACRLL